MENTIVTRTMQVNGYDMTVKEYQGKRVVTLKDIDICHNRPEGTARKRFNDNKHHFIEGTDFYKISPSEFRTAFGEESMDKRQQNDITLITESGYLMLVKSFTDDLAWDVQRQLVNAYFRVEKVMTENNELRKELSKLTDTVNYLSSIIMTQFALDVKSTNIWKKYIATPLIEEISNLSGLSVSECYDVIYEMMKNEYGFCESAILSKYNSKYNDSISTITIIANEPEYQKMFITTVNKIINTMKPKENIEDIVVPYATITSNSNIVFTLQDDIDVVLTYIAELIDDTSKNKIKTRRIIYSKMQTKRSWQIILGKYKCQTKHALINKVPKYKKKFIELCNMYIKECIDNNCRQE